MHGPVEWVVVVPGSYQVQADAVVVPGATQVQADKIQTSSKVIFVVALRQHICQL